MLTAIIIIATNALLALEFLYLSVLKMLKDINLSKIKKKFCKQSFNYKVILIFYVQNGHLEFLAMQLFLVKGRHKNLAIKHRTKLSNVGTTL